MAVERSPAKGGHSRPSYNPKKSTVVFDDLPVEVRLTKINVSRAGENLDEARKDLLNFIQEHRGIKPQVKSILTAKSKRKKAYIADSKLTECAQGIIELFDNKYALFMSTGPHPCKLGLKLFDAKKNLKKSTNLIQE